MPGPFPGMDPWLEHPARWPGTHQRLITHLAAELNGVLPEGYAADIGERLYVVQPDRSIYPDVAVLEHRRAARTSHGQAGGTAVASTADPPWVLTVEPVEVREVFVEILPVEGDRVVTVMEVLSHANKAPGSEGRRLYLTRQQELLESDTSLIEIDLLRAGEHTAAPPRERLEKRGRWDYLITLHRGGEGRRYGIWPVLLPEPLPRIRVPLASGDPDVELDLQKVFDRCYDEGPYARTLHYDDDPVPPLTEEQAAWADSVLRERGLRS